MGNKRISRHIARNWPLVAALCLPALAAIPVQAQQVLPPVLRTEPPASYLAVRQPDDANMHLDNPILIAKIHHAVDIGRDYLLREFPPGGPEKYMVHPGYAKVNVGVSLWALNRAGLIYADEPAMQRGYAWLIAQPRDEDPSSQQVIGNCTRVIALSAVKDRPAALQKCLEEDIRWLLECPSKEGTYDYNSQHGKSLPGNMVEVSYWVTCAMDAADKQGVHVPASFWPTMLKLTWDYRVPSGGWAPEWGHEWPPSLNGQTSALLQDKPSFNMTATGVCSMEMCLAHLSPSALASPEGRAMSAGVKEQIRWLDARAQWPTAIPLFVYSTAMPAERVCRVESLAADCGHVLLGQLRQVTGQKSWGKVDPYLPLAKAAIAAQNTGIARDGAWSNTSGLSDPRLTASIMLGLLSDPTVYPPPAATQASPAHLPAQQPRPQDAKTDKQLPEQSRASLTSDSPQPNIPVSIESAR